MKHDGVDPYYYDNDPPEHPIAERGCLWWGLVLSSGPAVVLLTAALIVAWGC